MRWGGFDVVFFRSLGFVLFVGVLYTGSCSLFGEVVLFFGEGIVDVVWGLRVR